MELNLSTLHIDSSKLIADLARPLVARAETNGLVAVIAWGICTSPEFRKNTDGIELALVFTGDPALTPQIVDGIAKISPRRRLQFEPPLILTLAEIESSRDVYTAEFHTIRTTGKVIAGELDLDATFTVDPADLRRQVEQEWRTVLFQARAALLGSGRSPRELGNIAAVGGSRLTYLIFATATALGVPLDPSKMHSDQGLTEAGAALQDLVGMDFSAAAQTIKLRRLKRPAMEIADFQKFLAWVEAVIRKVDAA